MLKNKEIMIKRLDKYHNYNNVRLSTYIESSKNCSCLGKDISIRSDDSTNEGYFNIIDEHRDIHLFYWKTNQYEGTVNAGIMKM